MWTYGHSRRDGNSEYNSQGAQQNLPTMRGPPLPALWVLLAALCPSPALPQVIVPGHKHELRVILPERCSDFALNGLHTGTIYSHHEQGEGGRYPSNADCSVHFSVRDGHVMYFEFEQFELQNKMKGVCQDYVQFHVATSPDTALTQRLCGKTLPSPFAANHSEIALRFRTNDKLEGLGFRLRFRRLSNSRYQQMQCAASGGDCDHRIQVPLLTPQDTGSNSTVSLTASTVPILLCLMATFGVVAYFCLRPQGLATR